MPSIAVLLKQEIVRLSRREVRSQMQATKRASAQYRRDIASLKRELGALTRQIALLLREALHKPPAIPSRSSVLKVRFVPKGLRSQRNRLGLSAEDYGKLVGVSAQSIYNWELGHTAPRAETLVAIAALRGVSKRAARARLEQMSAKTAKGSRRR